MNLGLPRSAIDAIGGVADLLARLPDVERAVAGAAAQAQSTLQEILDRVQPVSENLDDLRVTARRLDAHLETVEAHLVRLEHLIDPLEGRFTDLTESANRLDGDLMHVLDRVPGLSPKKARDQAERPI